MEYAPRVLIISVLSLVAGWLIYTAKEKPNPKVDGGAILTGETLSNYWKWKEFQQTNVHVFTMTAASVNAEELREFKSWMKRTNHWSTDGSTTKPPIAITNETKAETPQVRPFDIEAAVNSVDKSRPPKGISIRVSSDGKYWWVPGELSAHGPYNSYAEALKSYWWSWEFELRCDPKNMVEVHP